jgi:hypothetical protein
MVVTQEKPVKHRAILRVAPRNGRASDGGTCREGKDG